MIPYSKHSIDEKDIKSVVEVLQSNFLTTWPKVKAFEDALCKYTGAKYAVCVTNWTAALHCAYLALWLRDGDEVIVPANTFVSTANMVIAVWAKVVFSDIEMDSYNIDASKIEWLITKKTKAICVVHFSWNPCDMDEIWKIADKYNLRVIEDASHGLWWSYKWNKIWNLKSDMTTFSFHPQKSITTWEGGVIMTNNKEYYNELMSVRSHWIIKGKDWINNMIRFWLNYRLSDIQCALGLSQISKLDDFVNWRTEAVRLYNKYLSDNTGIILPNITDAWISSWHLYVVRFHSKEIRDAMILKLNELWYYVTIHYPPVYKHTYYQDNGYENISLQNSEEYFDTALSLPLFYWLSEIDIQKICQTISTK